MATTTMGIGCESNFHGEWVQEVPVEEGEGVAEEQAVEIMGEEVIGAEIMVEAAVREGVVIGGAVGTIVAEVDGIDRQQNAPNTG